MRIVFISLMEAFPWGGSEELWFRTALAAVRKGYEISVCVKHWAPSPNKIQQLHSEKAMIIERRTGKFVTILNALSRRLIGKETNFNKGYREAIMAFQPDVLLISCANTTDFFADDTIYPFIQKLGKPYFVISQFNADYGAPAREKIRERVNNIVVRWSKFYFVSERNRLSIERLMALKLSDTAIINNPVNITAPGLSAWPADPVLHLACVARFDTLYKGQDILLQTLREPEFANLNFKLSFFGAGPDENYIRRLIDLYSLSDKVRIIGHVSDIDEIWRNHHALVLPSLAEGTPLALQECMLKGRPALATDVGGNHVLVLDGFTGFLSPVASIACLKIKLLQLMALPMPALQTMGEKAFEHARAVIDPAPEKQILADIESAFIKKTGL